MSDSMIKEPEQQGANKPPKQLTGQEIVLKMLADQKFIREARQQGISYQELREKYGYQFKTV